MRISRIIIVPLMIYGCVDHVAFKVPDPARTLVVDGLITDEPGPYTVKLNYATNLNGILGLSGAASGASVIIFDDHGNSESLTEKAKGTYQTNTSGIQGLVGRQYHIEIQTADGKKYKSQPELLSPVGTLDSIYFDFQHSEQIVGKVVMSMNGFNIYVDASGFAGQQNFLRWIWTGTYKVFAHPELHVIEPHAENEPFFITDPLPCSGYIPDGFFHIKKVSDVCTCCVCWTIQYTNYPAVSDDQFFEDGKFSKMNIAYIQINGVNFYDKYYVEVQQLSLTPISYEFWKLIRYQETSASSLFQPPTAKITGNVVSLSDQSEVLGIFSASAVKRKSIYIHRSDIPYEYLMANDTLKYSCADYDSTSTPVQPSFWINN